MATGSQAMTSFYAKRIIGDSANSLVPNDGLLQVNVSDTKLVTRSHNNNSAYYIAYVDDTTAGIDIIEFKNINLKLTNTAGNTLTFSTSTIESSGELSVNTTSTSAVVFGGNIHTNGAITIGNLQGLNLILDNHSIFAREWDSTNRVYIDSALSLGGNTSIDGYLNVVGDFYSGGDIYLAEAKSIFMNYTVPGEEGEEGTPTDFPILVNNDDGTVSLNSLTGALLLGYLNTEEIHIYTSDSSTNTDWFVINEDGPYATTNLGVGGQDTDYVFYVNGTSLYTDTMRLENGSGDWATPSSFDIVCYDDKIFGITPTGNGKNVDIGYNWALGHGSGAAFRSSDWGDGTGNDVGSFVFFARKDTTAQYTLTGRVTGVLQWTGEFIADGHITANDGYLKSTANSNTVTIGSQNATWCHIYNSAAIPFIFNNTIACAGTLNDTSASLGTTSYPFHHLILGGVTDGTLTAASTNPRITFQEGQGTQPVHLIYSDWDSYRAPAGLKVIGGTSATPAWFEVEGDIHARALNLYPGEGSYREGIRIHSYGSWSDITLCGNDNTGASGTSANSWFLGNNNGNFYIARNGSPGSTAYLSCVSNAWTFLGSVTTSGGLEIKGHIAGDSGTTGHGLYSGGAYHNAYNNIILQGDGTTGSSGIAFVSSKGTTTINQPSDRAFIQFHAYGVTTYTAEGTAPTLATSGEANVLVIGVGNDAADTVRLQTPGRTGLLHQVAANAYVIPDTNNTTGSVGGTTTPVYIDGGIIKTCTAYASASVNYATSSGSCSGNAATATTASTLAAYASIGSSTTDHGVALKNWFTSNKSTAPRNKVISFYSATSGNGSQYIGYFLSGYADNPYGGFFVCHYNNPYYVGIFNGTYTQQHILTSTNYTSYTVTKTGSGASGSWGISVTGSSASCTGNAASATKLQTARSLWGNSFNGTDDITGAINCSDIRGGNVRLTSNWVGFYQNANAGGSRYGYIQCNADRMYFRKENGVSTYHFDMNGGYLLTSRCYNAVWNDYAECRQVETEEPGRCVTESKSGTMVITTKRLQAGCKVISDTYGTCIGATNLVKTPIAVSGRVLAYPYRNRTEYPLGAAVCSAPNGTVDIMSRDEIMMYPERIVGTVSEIPNYDVWHAGSDELPEDIEVNGRIWIYVR